MARKTLPLDNTQIKNAKPKEKEYKLFDGGGLYILIKPNGSKGWRLKYLFEGKENRLSLGVYPLVGLADARIKRDEFKKMVASGINPSEKSSKTQRGCMDRSKGLLGMLLAVSRRLNCLIVVKMNRL